MAIDFTVIKLKFYFCALKATGDVYEDLIDVHSFLGRDWRRPSHLVIEAAGRLWLIPMKDVDEKLQGAGGDSDDLDDGAYFVEFHYKGNNQKLIESLIEDWRSNSDEIDRSEIKIEKID